MRVLVAFLFLTVLHFQGIAQYFPYKWKDDPIPVFKKERKAELKTLHNLAPDFCRHLELPFKEAVLLDDLLNRQKLFASLSLTNLDKSTQFSKRQKNYLQEDFDKMIDYLSVEISTTENGQHFSTRSLSEKLTKGQLKLIAAQNFGAEIKVRVRFKYKDANIDYHDGTNPVKEGEFKMKIVPETEAGFPGGKQGLSDYFRKHVTNRIPEPAYGQIVQPSAIKFTVNEQGEVEDLKIRKGML